MLNKRDEYIDYVEPVLCQECGTELDVWIDHIPQITALCPDCALMIGRRLLEDVLCYHNGNAVSLLSIMRYGKEKTKVKRRGLAEFM